VPPPLPPVLLDEELLDEELLDEELLDEEALLPPPKPLSGADTEHAAPERSAAPSMKGETGRLQRARCMDVPIPWLKGGWLDREAVVGWVGMAIWGG
jgi:hypothetical protein